MKMTVLGIMILMTCHFRNLMNQLKAQSIGHVYCSSRSFPVPILTVLAVLPLLRTMSKDLRSRLLKAQAILGKPERPAENENYKKKSLPELEEEIVPQGKCKGKTFQWVWENDQDYVIWSTSGLPRRAPWMEFLHYIELKTAEMEKEAGITQTKVKAKPLAKESMLPFADEVPIESDEEDGWEQAAMLTEKASQSSQQKETTKPSNPDLQELTNAITGMMGMLQNMNLRLEQVEYHQHHQQ